MKKYLKPEIEIKQFAVADIITSSDTPISTEPIVTTDPTADPLNLTPANYQAENSWDNI